MTVFVLRPISRLCPSALPSGLLRGWEAFPARAWLSSGPSVANRETFAILFAGYGEASQPAKVEEAYLLMKRLGLLLDTNAATALVGALETSGTSCFPLAVELVRFWGPLSPKERSRLPSHLVPISYFPSKLRHAHEASALSIKHLSSEGIRTSSLLAGAFGRLSAETVVQGGHPLGRRAKGGESPALKKRSEGWVWGQTPPLFVPDLPVTHVSSKGIRNAGRALPC
eukprot:RCo014655